MGRPVQSTSMCGGSNGKSRCSSRPLSAFARSDISYARISASCSECFCQHLPLTSKAFLCFFSISSSKCRGIDRIMGADEG
jgi:hypothetical protein